MKRADFNFIPYREEADGPGTVAVLALMLVAVLLGLLAPDPAQGQLRSPIRNLTNDTTPASGDMLLVDKATPLASRKLTLHTLAGYLATDTYLTPSTRTITCTAPLLCAGTTSMDLGADRTISIAPFYLPLAGGTMTGDVSMGTNKITIAAPYTPASGGAPFRLLTSGSTLTGGSNQGLRTSLMGLYDTRTSANDGVALNVEVLQTSHSSTIVRTGIQCSAYTEPDNGGDTSCGLFVSSGGGPGLTIYKHYGLRPTGLTDQSLSPQPALEVGSGDAGPAIIASAGVTAWGTSKTNEAVEARLGSSTSIGVLAWPTDNVFDTRIAFAVGSPQSNAQPVNLKFKVLANGNVSTPGTIAATGAVTGSNLSGTNTGDQVVPANTTATSSRWFSAYNSTTGAFTESQPAFTDISGSASCAQLPALTGDVTSSSCATTLSSSFKGWTDAGTSISTTTSTDKVGIGTSAPTSPLTATTNTTTLPTPLAGTIAHLAAVDSTGTVLALDSFSAVNTMACRRANGTAASPSAIGLDDIICNLGAYGYGTSAYGSTPGAAIRPRADQAWTNTAQGTRLDFLTDDLNTTTPTTKFSISAMGHISHTQTTAPTVACTGTGTSPAAPTIDSGGTDHKFTVTINTGTGSPGSTGTCTITFATAFPAARPIVCMLVKGATAWGNSSTIMETTESASAPVFTWTNLVGGVATALTVSTSYKFSCIGGF